MLNKSQYKTLASLIDLYEEKKTSVRGEEIADRTSRTPGTIRNQMQILHALGYVEGILVCLLIIITKRSNKIDYCIKFPS